MTSPTPDNPSVIAPAPGKGVGVDHWVCLVCRMPRNPSSQAACVKCNAPRGSTLPNMNMMMNVLRAGMVNTMVAPSMGVGLQGPNPFQQQQQFGLSMNVQFSQQATQLNQQAGFSYPLQQPANPLAYLSQQVGVPPQNIPPQMVQRQIMGAQGREEEDLLSAFGFKEDDSDDDEWEQQEPPPRASQSW